MGFSYFDNNATTKMDEEVLKAMPFCKSRMAMLRQCSIN